MTLKVVDIKPQINTTVIDDLRHMLTLAETGEITAAVIVGQSPAGDLRAIIGECPDRYAMAGKLMKVSMELLK